MENECLAGSMPEINLPPVALQRKPVALVFNNNESLHILTICPMIKIFLCLYYHISKCHRGKPSHYQAFIRFHLSNRHPRDQKTSLHPLLLPRTLSSLALSLFKTATVSFCIFVIITSGLSLPFLQGNFALRLTLGRDFIFDDGLNPFHLTCDPHPACLTDSAQYSTLCVATSAALLP